MNPIIIYIHTQLDIILPLDLNLTVVNYKPSYNLGAATTTLCRTCCEKAGFLENTHEKFFQSHYFINSIAEVKKKHEEILAGEGPWWPPEKELLPRIGRCFGNGGTFTEVSFQETGITGIAGEASDMLFIGIHRASSIMFRCQTLTSFLVGNGHNLPEVVPSPAKFLSLTAWLDFGHDPLTSSGQCYCTIFWAIFSGDIPWNLGLNNRPNIYGIGTSNQSVPEMASGQWCLLV